MDMLEVMEKATGEKWVVESVSSNELLGDAKVAFERGDMRTGYVKTVLKVNFDGLGAAYFRSGLEWEAGGRLGVRRKTLLEIAEEVVAGLEKGK